MENLTDGQSVQRKRAAHTILGGIRISEVWIWLGGPALRRAGEGSHRGQAFWRRGDGLNISLRDDRNVWYDHRDGHGGGVLDLVVLIRGGSRADALRWIANQCGRPLEPLSAADHRKRAAERREIERHLEPARHWQYSAIALAETLLREFTSFDPAGLQPEIGEIGRFTSQLRRWQRLDDVGLVDEFGWWRTRDPGLTVAMIRAGARREAVERAWLRRSF
jgi:hypothetical protein